jgi:hypothetical protein
MGQPMNDVLTQRWEVGDGIDISKTKSVYSKNASGVGLHIFRGVWTNVDARQGHAKPD